MNDVKIEIDQYPKIPPYLEIEGPEESIEAAVKLLGYAMTDTVSLRATEVLQKYQVDKDVLVFD